jgi:hypothetical protein
MQLVYNVYMIEVEQQNITLGVTKFCKTISRYNVREIRIAKFRIHPTK